MYAYMNVRMMRAYERAGAYALVCPSICLSVCMYVYMYVFIYVCMCVSIYACMCVRACVRFCVWIYVFPLLFFLTSNLLHLESNIYVGLLAYMRTHARQHLKLEVRHKNSHGRLYTYTHILNGQTHATGTQIHVCTHVPTRPKGSGFEPHRRHCVVVLEQDTFILA